MDKDPFDLVGDTIDGQFRVDEFAGEGDLSVVYKGFQPSIDAIVAIKCLNLPATLDPALVEPFVRSFREGSKISYRLSRDNLNIAQSLSSGTTLAPRTGQLVPYLVREWLEGTSLTVELATRRAERLPGMEFDLGVALLEGAADGLAFAHAQGVPHHSINPSNLFVVTKGGQKTVKVLDFGVAKVMNEAALRPKPAASETASKVAGLRVLMAQYAAPEQLDQQVGALGPATDVYSFALVLLEVLAGRPAMASKEAAPVLHLDPASRPTPRACGLSLRRRVDDVFVRAVSLDPTKRQPNLGVFWKELTEAALAPGVSLLPKRPSLSPRPPVEPRVSVKPTPPLPPKPPLPSKRPSLPEITDGTPTNELSLGPVRAAVATPVQAEPAQAPQAETRPSGTPMVFSLTKKTLTGFGPVKPPGPPGPPEDGPQAARPPPALAIAPPPLPIGAALDGSPVGEPAMPVTSPVAPDGAAPSPPPSAERHTSRLMVDDLPKVIVIATPPGQPPPEEPYPRDVPTQRLPRISDARASDWPSRFALAAVVGVIVLGGAGFGARLLFLRRAPRGGSALSNAVVSTASAAPEGHAAAQLSAPPPSDRASASPVTQGAAPASGAPPAAPVGAGAESGSAQAPSPSATPSAAPVIAKRFRRAAATTALDQAATELSDCRELGSLWGPGSIRAAFSNDGSVNRLMIGPPYAGTQEGSCVAAHFRAAHMQPFAGTAGAVNYTFNLAK